MCTKCDVEKEFSSSKRVAKVMMYKQRRIIYTTMQTIGQGYSGLEKLTTHMDLPRPMTQNNYAAVKTIEKAVHQVAEESMKDAGELRPNNNENEIVDVDISGDGSWQRRGFSSLNGTFTAIS